MAEQQLPPYLVTDAAGVDVTGLLTWVHNDDGSWVGTNDTGRVITARDSLRTLTPGDSLRFSAPGLVR